MLTALAPRRFLRFYFSSKIVFSPAALVSLRRLPRSPRRYLISPLSSLPPFCALLLIFCPTHEVLLPEGVFKLHPAKKKRGRKKKEKASQNPGSSQSLLTKCHFLRLCLHDSKGVICHLFFFFFSQILFSLCIRGESRPPPHLLFLSSAAALTPSLTSDKWHSPPTHYRGKMLLYRNPPLALLLLLLYLLLHHFGPFPS